VSAKIECPFCNAVNKYEPDRFEDGHLDERECAECEKTFLVETVVTANYYVQVPKQNNQEPTK
jgi:transposase-like protein